MSDDDDATPRALESAEVVREYGPFPEVARVHGVTHDGERVWFATGAALRALDPATGELVEHLDVACDAGTAFDGTSFFQIAGEQIHKIDRASGRVVASIPAPAGGRDDSGLAWADGSLWVGQYHARRIYQIDPATGAVLRTIASDRFVTGVTWVDGELWHGCDENGGELRRVDPATGEVEARLAMPSGACVSGVESDGGDLLFCGGGRSGTIRAVRRPRRR